MKRGTSLILIGLVLAALGAAGLIYESFSYPDEEMIFDLGSVEASVTTEKEVDIPPILSGLVLVAGLGVAAVGVSRTG